MKKAIFVLTLLVGLLLTAEAQSQRAQVVVPLEGMDPVALTQGKDLMGLEKFAVTRGEYQYWFANAENKALFEKDPARYEIQLGSTCARMGPGVGGNPDIFTVYKERIYIFGSGDCLKLFEAAPEKYLEPAAPAKIAATPEAIKKGQALIEKAVQAAGGRAVIDGLTTYQEKGLVPMRTQQGTTEMKTVLMKVYPDRIRQERLFPSFGTVADVLTPGEAFVATPRGVSAMRDMPRADIEKRIKRNPLEVLRARKSSDFVVAALGPGKVGDTAVEQVAVAFAGVNLQVGLDPATGRILSLSYRGRNRTGEVGEVVQMFSDFRAVNGLILPFKTTGTFNGQPDPDQTYTIEEIVVNGKIDPMAFEKPKVAGAQ